jgi:hypothetical protein
MYELKYLYSPCDVVARGKIKKSKKIVPWLWGLEMAARSVEGGA